VASLVRARFAAWCWAGIGAEKDGRQRSIRRVWQTKSYIGRGGFVPVANLEALSRFSRERVGRGSSSLRPAKVIAVDEPDRRQILVLSVQGI
jgi:hypothetical protein